MMNDIKPVWDRDGCQLFHADCMDILESLPTPDLYLLDLPYGISLQNHAKIGTKKRTSHDWTISGDDTQELGVRILESISGPVIAFASPMKPWPGKWRQHLVWDKGPTVGGGGDPATCWKQSWELIQVRDTPPLNGPRDEAVLHYYVTHRDYALHPCAKPIALLKYLIHKSTNPGDLVIDLTCGSGSTVRSALETGRKAIGVESDINFITIAAQRMQQKVFAWTP